LALILEAVVEGIVFVDSNKTIAYINQAGREILHCSLQDDPLPTFNELTALLGFDPLAVTTKGSVSREPLAESNGEEAVEDTLDLSSPPWLGWQQEATIFGVPYLVRGSTISSASPDSGGTVLCFADTKESRQREQIIAENLSFASHELLTPLTAIKNALDLLSDQRLGSLSDKQVRFVQLASRNVERLNNLMTAILDLSQLETQSITLELEEIDVVEPVERVLATVRDLAQEKGVELEIQLQEKYPRLLADADRLRQVVYNLVHNAIKFTPEGGSVQVSLEVVDRDNLSKQLPSDAEIQLPDRVGDGSLLLTVADDGVGIPAAHIKSIFAKFHQGQGPSTDQHIRGSGLGLAVVKTMVEAHGGAVWVESEPEEGSRFQVLLPKLSREEHLIRTAAATLQRVRAVGSLLTLVILKVVPTTKEVISDPHQQEEMLNLFNQVVAAAQSTVRLKGDRVEVLDHNLRVFSLLAEIDPKDVPAVLQRVTSNLKHQAEEKGQILNLQLIWGMASYPGDVSTARELVEAAVQAAAATEAEVIHVEQR
jgi:signal transduction histidine kinase